MPQSIAGGLTLIFPFETTVMGNMDEVSDEDQTAT